MTKLMPKEIWDLLKRFKDRCIKTNSVCKEIFYRTGRLDITVKYDDIKFLHDNGATQSVRSYLTGEGDEVKKPVWIPFSGRMVSLLVKSLEGYETVFNLTRSIDYGYDLMSTVGNPVITQYDKIVRYTLGSDMKRYLYPADSLTVSQIPENIAEYLKRIDESYTKKVSAIINIYMKENRPYIRLYSGAGVQICDRDFESTKDNITDYIKITKSWSEYVEKITELCYKRGINVYQMYIILSGKFKGLVSTREESNNEYTMILY